ncbi:MAG: NAD-dependent protein deacylase [Ectothiorhodospiraceae bacterium]|nr:NAD-dependent protein deacylase [Ectothiorhodospiraceae bacterium]
MYSEALITALMNADSVAVLTGAGVSAESGVKTFRDPDGLWMKFKPEELANFDAFMRNPELVWEWYNHRKEIAASVKPNPGHYAIAEMESLFKEFTLITQNVDDLHRRAGTSNPIELHGNITRSFCIDCNKFYDKVEVSEQQKIPKCDCGGMIRPDVVWFGEMLPMNAIQTATAAAQDADVFFSIGTSGEVYPAAQLPGIARQYGAYVVEVNPGKTSISFQMNECLLGPSGVVLPPIIEELKRRKLSA